MITQEERTEGTKRPVTLADLIAVVFCFLWVLETYLKQVNEVRSQETVARRRGR